MNNSGKHENLKIKQKFLGANAGQNIMGMFYKYSYESQMIIDVISCYQPVIFINSKRVPSAPSFVSVKVLFRVSPITTVPKSISVLSTFSWKRRESNVHSMEVKYIRQYQKCTRKVGDPAKVILFSQDYGIFCGRISNKSRASWTRGPKFKFWYLYLWNMEMLTPF